MALFDPPEFAPACQGHKALLFRVLMSLALLGATGAALADEVPALPGRPGDFTLAAPAITDAVAASGFYLRVDGGSSYLASGDISLGPRTRHYGGGPGWTVGGGIGYRILPQLRLDATVDVINHNNLSETALMTNLYWDLFTLGRATPYLGAGIGAAQLTISSVGPINALAPGLQRTDWQTAWSLMVGNSWALLPNVTLTTGYRYLYLGTPSFNLANRPVELLFSGVEEHQFRIGLRYSFN